MSIRKTSVFSCMFAGLFWGQLSFGLGRINITKDDVATLPPTIQTVKHCGNWKFGQLEGIYRLILTNVYGGAGTEVYVQFLANPENGKDNSEDYKILKTLDFPELNNDHNQYIFESIECKKTGKTTYIQLKGSNEHDENNKMHHISIKILDMEHYKINDKTK